MSIVQYVWSLARDPVDEDPRGRAGAVDAAGVFVTHASVGLAKKFENLARSFAAW